MAGTTRTRPHFLRFRAWRTGQHCFSSKISRRSQAIRIGTSPRYLGRNTHAQNGQLLLFRPVGGFCLDLGAGVLASLARASQSPHPLLAVTMFLTTGRARPSEAAAGTFGVGLGVDSTLFGDRCIRFSREGSSCGFADLDVGLCSAVDPVCDHNSVLPSSG